MGSKEILGLIRMSTLYNRTPSELLNLEDEYTGYCLNEACMYIKARMDNGEEMKVEAHYSSFASLYDSYKRG